jgi:chorismate-pyruvate lyase
VSNPFVPQPPRAPDAVAARIGGHLGLALPVLHPVAAAALPASCRALLEHQDSMTATLERRWGEAVVIDCIASAVSEPERTLDRFVALRTGRTGAVVELAAIRIHLDTVPESLRPAVVAGGRPFGAILAGAGIAFRGRPVAYFRLQADALVAGRCAVSEGATLYGRLNQLVRADGALLCETVEILPRA